MSDLIARSVLEVAGDASQFEAAMARAEAVAKRFETTATASAGKASTALSNVGKGSGAGAAEAERASKRFTASLEREVAQLGLSRNAYLVWQAQQRGIPQDVYEPLIRARARAAAAQDAEAEAARRAEAAQRSLQQRQASFLAQLQQQVDLQGKSHGEMMRHQAAQLGLSAQAERYIVQLDRTGKSQQFVGLTAGQATQAMRLLPMQITDVVTSLASGMPIWMVAIQQGGQLRDSFGGVSNMLRGVASVISPAVVGFAALAAVAGVVAYSFVNGEQEMMAFERAMVSSGNAAGVTKGRLVELAEAANRYGSTRGQASGVLAQLVQTGQVAGEVLDRAAEAAIRLDRNGVAAIGNTVKAFAELGRSPLDSLRKLNEGTNFLTLSIYKQVRALQEQGKTAEAARVAQEAYANAGNERMKDLESRLGYVEKAWRTIKTVAKEGWDAILNIGRPDTTEEALAAARAQIDAILKSTGGVEPAAGTYSAGRLAAARASAMLLAEQAKQERALAATQAEGAAAARAAMEADDKLAASRKRLAEESVRAAEAARKMVQAMDLEAAGYDASFIDDMLKLQAAAKAADWSTEQLDAQIKRLLTKQPFSQAWIKAGEAYAEAQRKSAEETARAAEAREKDTQALRDQYIELTAGKEALDTIINLRYEEAAAMAEQQAMHAGAGALSEQEAEALRQTAQQMREQIALRQAIARATAGQAVDEANKKAADEAKRAWARSAEQIGDALTDNIMRGGKDALQYIQDYARTLVLRPIVQAVVQPLAGAVAGLLTGGEGGAGGANWLQSASQLNTLYGAYSGNGGVLGALANTSYGQTVAGWLGISNATAGTGVTGYLGSGLALTGTGTATGTGLTLGSGMGGTGYGLSANSGAWAGMFANEGAATGAAVSQGSAAAGGPTWGAYAGYAALFAAAVMASQSAWNKGFKNDQLTGAWRISPESTFTDLLKVGGMNDKWANILGGGSVYTSLFGRAAPRVESQGLQGSIGAGDFTGQAYADVLAKGGIFRSDKRWQETAALPEELGRFMDDAAKAVYEQAEAFGKALGLPAEQLAGITQQVRVELTDNAEANMKAIAEAMAGYGDALVGSWADEVAALTQYGESAAQTIARVGSAIVGVNDVLRTLGMTALQASVDGGQAAVALQDRFGGIGGLQNVAGGYLQNYYSDTERNNLTRGYIEAALADVSLALPGTREELRGMVTQLVDGGALMTEAGREQVSVLLSVADAFASITASGRSAADILREQQDLQMQIWRETGDQVAIRAFERAQVAPENLGLFDQLTGLREAKLAEESAAAAAQAAADAERERLELLAQQQSAMEQMAAAAMQAAEEARQAWAGAHQSMRDEIARLRGEGLGMGSAMAQTNFAMATARARAGDVDAATGLSALARAAADERTAMAASGAEADMIAASIAASLATTLRVTGGDAGTRDVVAAIQSLETRFAALEEATREGLAANASHTNRMASDIADAVSGRQPLVVIVETP